MKSRLIGWMKSSMSAVFTIVIALLIGAVLITWSGTNPIEAYTELFKGAFSTTHRLFETLLKAIPLLIMGLGVSIAFKNLIWNIGLDGQFTIGAIFALAVGIYLPLPAYILLPLSIAAGILGGALWSGLAGLLKVKFNANEVITTLMLNYVASYFLAYLVYGPMKDPKGFDFPQTPLIPDSLKLPLFIPAERLHYGVFIVVILVILMIFFWRSTLGFRIELMGQGQGVSEYAGVKTRRTMIISMMLSGAFAGLAGWMEVYGVQYRLMTDVSSGYGNIAIVVALLGALNPIGITVAAFFFAALMVGGNSMQRMTDVPYTIVNIIQGLIIIFVITRSMLNIDSVKGFVMKLFRRCKDA